MKKCKNKIWKKNHTLLGILWCKNLNINSTYKNDQKNVSKFSVSYYGLELDAAQT